MAAPDPQSKPETAAFRHNLIIGIDFDGTIADTNQVKAEWIKKKLRIDLPPSKCDRSQSVPIIGLENYKKWPSSFMTRPEPAPPHQSTALWRLYSAWPRTLG